MKDPFADLGRDTLDPFRPVDMIIEYVSAAAGAQKTRTAIMIAVETAKELGRKTIDVSPTEELLKEKMAFARECDPAVKLYEITSDQSRIQYRKSGGGVGKRIRMFIEKHANDRDGLILFITHEGFNRISTVPPEAAEFHLLIDEEPNIVLTRKPFQLRYSHWVLTNFIDINPIPTTLEERSRKIVAPPEFTYNDPNIPSHIDQKTDESKAISHALRIKPEYGASETEIAMAHKELARLKAKHETWQAWLKQGDNARINGEAKSYYLLTPKEDPSQIDPLVWVKLRQDGVAVDNIYEYLDPIPRWLLQEAALFTDMTAWNAMTIKPDPENPVEDRGLVTIIGFRRPDILKVFARVTIISAMFEHTMTYMVWKSLGVRFVPSREIDIDVPRTSLGKRKLNIYWLYDEGWSKYIRNASGGIKPVLELIKQSGIVEADAEICAIVNKKEEYGYDDPAIVREVFPKAVIMPHNSKGLNRFRHHHQLIHLAALNAHTRDIQWLESVLGINVDQQRIARTAQEVYQAAMRISLREPKSTADVDIIVSDKAVAEWFAQWFEPSDQISVFEIDSTGVIKRKGKRGRKPIGDRKMTQSEMNKRYLAKKKQKEDETQDS